jgi:hypothetical protein
LIRMIELSIQLGPYYTTQTNRLVNDMRYAITALSHIA